MFKKSFLLVILFAFVSLCGCCTVAKGTAGAAGGAASGLAQGAKEGAKDDRNAIKKTDDWIKDNLW